jgi:hypothetical protein
MEGQRPVSGLNRILTGVLIAFLGALSYDLYKEKFVSGNVGGETGRGGSSGTDVIEPVFENTVMVVPSKPRPQPPPPVPVVNRVVVPDLVGMDVETAFRTVEGLGLQVQRRDGADRSAAGWVETQWPPSQQLADAGATVSLGVRLPAVEPIVQAPPLVQEAPRFSQPIAITTAPAPIPVPYPRYGRGVPNPRYRYRTDAPTVRDRDPLRTGVPSPRYPYSRGVPNPNARYRRNLPDLQDPLQTGVPNPRRQYRPVVPDPGFRYRPGVPNSRSQYPYRTGVPSPGDRYRTGVPNFQDSHRAGVPRSFYRPGVPAPQRQNRPPDRWRSSPYRRGPG